LDAGHAVLERRSEIRGRILRLIHRVDALLQELREFGRAGLRRAVRRRGETETGCAMHRACTLRRERADRGEYAVDFHLAHKRVSLSIRPPALRRRLRAAARACDAACAG